MWQFKYFLKEIPIWKLKKQIIKLIATLETRTYVVILNKLNNILFKY